MERESVAVTRIKNILDPGSLVELQKEVCFRSTDLTGQETSLSSDGVVTGYGLVEGRLVFFFSQDPEVLHGTIGEMHCKKIIEVLKKAVAMGAPVIGIFDSAGIRLLESVDALDGLGQLIAAYNEASGLVPLISVVAGNCGGGLSTLLALSDFVYVLKGKGKLFVNSPNTIDGNYLDKLDTSAPDFQGLYTGLVDEIVDENELNQCIGSILALIPANNTEGTVTLTCEDDLNRLLEGVGAANFDLRYFLSQVSDNGVFVETKSMYEPGMITGFIILNGMTIGVFGNDTEDGRLTPEAMDKAASFISYCDAYEIPLLCVSDVTGFETTLHSEKNLSKAMARLSSVLVEADVPKVTLIPRRASSSAGILMNSKAFGADFVYAYKEATLGAVEGKEAVKIIGDMDSATYDEKYNSALAFAKKGVIDGIIEPADTRKYLVSAFDLLYTKYTLVQDKKHSLR